MLNYGEMDLTSQNLKIVCFSTLLKLRLYHSLEGSFFMQKILRFHMVLKGP